MEGGPVAIFPVQLHAIDRDLSHFGLVHVTQELGKINLFVFLPATTLLNNFPQQKGRQPNHQPESYGFDSRIHQETPQETRARSNGSKPRCFYHQIRCRSANLDRQINFRSLFYSFLRKKGR
jgi:hypothetical protein